MGYLKKRKKLIKYFARHLQLEENMNKKQKHATIFYLPLSLSYFVCFAASETKLLSFKPTFEKTCEPTQLKLSVIQADRQRDLERYFL